MVCARQLRALLTAGNTKKLRNNVCVAVLFLSNCFMHKYKFSYNKIVAFLIADVKFFLLLLCFCKTKPHEQLPRV